MIMKRGPRQDRAVGLVIYILYQIQSVDPAVQIGMNEMGTYKLCVKMYVISNCVVFFEMQRFLGGSRSTIT